MSFTTGMNNEAAKTFTENGQLALNTTGNACLDFFSVCGSLRNASNDRITRLFEDSYNVDKLIATKTLFYLRDIREGLGERETFRTLLNYAAKNHPECIRPNIKYIETFGRYDDLYSLIDTPLEKDMWVYVKEQLNKDITNMRANKPVSLLAKWLKTADASSKTTRKQGIYTALHLGYTVRDYKKIIKSLRKYINIIESKMTQNKWEDIDYSAVPSKAMSKYTRAFLRHDINRFNNYLSDVASGKKKINASTLYPYDILRKFDNRSWDFFNHNLTEDELKVLNAQWDNLPNYVSKNSNAIVMADTSGSMSGLPIFVSVSLAIYFAQRNIGPYHNLWMSFSANPTIHKIKGRYLEQITKNIDTTDWDCNTDLNAAMEKILDIAIENRCKPEEIPKALIVISDMEIDCCTNELFYSSLKSKFENAGYTIPNIIFWNVNSRHDVYHGNKNDIGVQCVSGCSPSIFKNVMDMIDLTPEECMYKYLNTERYDCISVS